MTDLEQPSEELEIPKETPEELPKEPSKFALFLRKLLRWATGTLTIFTLGIVLMWIVQVRPRTIELRELESQFQSANQEIDELAGELDILKAVDAENATLEATLDETLIHLRLLSVLVDVSISQLALNDGNLEMAQAALAETDSKLDLLAIDLDGNRQDTVEAMQERLSLALGEINEDTFAAQSDLEVLRNTLLALERSLFGD